MQVGENLKNEGCEMVAGEKQVKKPRGIRMIWEMYSPGYKNNVAVGVILLSEG